MRQVIVPERGTTASAAQIKANTVRSYTSSQQASENHGVLRSVGRGRAQNVNLHTLRWSQSTFWSKRAAFRAAACVTSQNRTPDRGLRPTLTTNCDHWRMAIHTPSAGVPEAERVVQFSVRTTRERLLKFISNATFAIFFYFFVHARV